MTNPTRQEILNDRSLTAHHRAQLFAQMDAAGIVEVPGFPPLTTEIAAELRELAAAIQSIAKAVEDFDAQNAEHRTMLLAARGVVESMEYPASLPDDSMIQKLIFERARAELLQNFLARGPARRAALAATFRPAVQKLADRLLQCHPRTMERFFMQPNQDFAEAARQSFAEVERVIAGQQDEYEKLNNIFHAAAA